MANAVRRGRSGVGSPHVRFLFCGIFAAMHFAAIGSWYHEPSVKATVRTGVEKTRAYFMNMSADGEWLLLNLHCDQAGYGLQLYPVDQLLAADGVVDADNVGVKTFADRPACWKGGAVSSDLIVPGDNNQGDAAFSVLCRGAGNNLTSVPFTGMDRGSDGLDFNPSGTRLYANGSSGILIYDTTKLSVDGGMVNHIGDTVDVSAKRVRNLSCYEVNSRELVYFGEGNVAEGAKSVYVYDASSGDVKTLATSDLIDADVTNVKLSGTTTASPVVYVLVSSGRLIAFKLSADGLSVASDDPILNLDPEMVRELCGIDDSVTNPTFNNFEVTDDGETAFFTWSLKNSTTSAAPALTVVRSGYDKVIEISSDTTFSESLGEDVRSLLITGAGVLSFLPSSVASLSGGVTVNAVQVRAQDASVFGTGPVRLLNGAALYNMNAEKLEIENQIVFGDSAWAASQDSKILRLHGLAADSEDKAVLLGRSGTGASTVELALEDAKTEPINVIQLRGNCNLTVDGGVLKAAGSAIGDFITKVGSAKPTLSVSSAGFKFIAEDGADVTLGGNPSLNWLPARVQTNVQEVAAAAPANSGFEDGTTGWKCESDGNTASVIGAISLPNSTWRSDITAAPEGSYVYGCRWGKKLTSNNGISIPDGMSGRWRVKFECAPRKGSYGSERLPVEIIIGDQKQTVSYSLGGGKGSDGSGGFITLTTDWYELSAGAKTFVIRITHGDVSNTNGALLLDNIRLEYGQLVPIPVEPIVKDGSGSLSLATANCPHDLKVEEGNLTIPLSVLSDGIHVTVAGGGQLSLVTETLPNLIVNGSFEADGKKTFNQLNPQGWQYDPTPQTGSGAGTSSGIQANKGTVTSDGPWTTYGDCTAYIRRNTSLSQTVNVSETGTYGLSFVLAHRKNQVIPPLSVSVDGQPVLSDIQHADTGYTRYVCYLPLTEGNHIITFSTGNASSANGMLFLDDVKLAVSERTEIENATLSLTSGSTLVLDTFSRPHFKQVTVDGVEINGKNKRALIRAGVRVTGVGDATFGDEQGPGLCIIVR